MNIQKGDHGGCCQWSIQMKSLDGGTSVGSEESEAYRVYIRVILKPSASEDRNTCEG